MDNWRVAVLGDGGVGKTALAVQVSTRLPFCITTTNDCLVYSQLLCW
jgi:tRNA A37 N6-isopentenylltransferase MiaA